MKLLRKVKNLPELNSGSVATIGNFDGVHLGHQALLNTLTEKANRLNLPSVVVLFEPQPSEYFLSDEAPARLSSLREKLLLLKKHGVDIVLCLKFDKQLAQMKPEPFARQCLFKALNCRHLLVGEDFRFGYKRQGDLSLLQIVGRDYGCEVHSFPDFVIHDMRVSSTKVRLALANDRLETAAGLLGRTYSMCGKVMPGAGRGREWGVPTANLKLNRHSLPLKGVFCVKIKRKQQWLNGIANLGSRPTVDGKKNLLEIHLLDFDESLYGELLQVFFLHKLRDEVKFNSIDELIQQIYTDVETCRQYFLGEKHLNNDFVE